jgi:hypothetical protein
MNKLHPTFDIPMEFIENSISIGIKLAEASHRGERKHINDYSPYSNDLKRIYFVGAGLVLDTRDEFGQEDVITISHESECFGSFAGGPRRLLSIDAVRNLEKLMQLCEINHTPKNW